MPTRIPASSKIESEKVSKHPSVNGVFQVALPKPWVYTIDLKFPLSNVGLVQSVFIDVVRLVLIEDEKQCQDLLCQIGPGWCRNIQSVLVKFTWTIND